MILISILKMIGKLKTELIVSEYIYIYISNTERIVHLTSWVFAMQAWAKRKMSQLLN